MFLNLHRAAALRRISVSEFVEESLERTLSKITASGDIIKRLRYAQALVNDVIIFARKEPLQGKKGPANIHEETARQIRRNELSDKTHAAMEQVYGLAQSEKLAAENQTRAAMYTVLASLATVDALILKDAADEEVLAEIAKLREEDAKFEETTRELESRTPEKTPKA